MIRASFYHSPKTAALLMRSQAVIWICQNHWVFCYSRMQPSVINVIISVLVHLHQNHQIMYGPIICNNPVINSSQIPSTKIKQKLKTHLLAADQHQMQSYNICKAHRHLSRFVMWVSYWGLLWEYKINLMIMHGVIICNIRCHQISSMEIKVKVINSNRGHCSQWNRASKNYNNRMSCQDYNLKLTLLI